MSYIDILIVVGIGFFALKGFWKGLIHAIFSIIAFIVGILIAYLYNDELALWFAKYIPWGEAARQSIAFFVLLIVDNRLIGFLLWVVDKFLLGFIWHLPFIGSLNRLLGLVFGFLEGVVLIGIILAFLIAHPAGDWLVRGLGGSALTPIVAPLGAVFLPSISGVVEKLSEFTVKVEGTITSTTR